MNPKIITAVILCMFLVTFISTSQASMEATRIKEAQEAINTPAFDAGTAVGSGYSDTIDPITGALSISITDAVIPGRNGMNVEIVRKYDSNVFLSLNKKFVDITPQQEASGDYVYEGVEQGSYFLCMGSDGNGQNTYTCDNCYGGTDWIVDGRNMDRCYFQNSDSSSWKRPEYLGRSWTINYQEARLKDPTPLLYGYFPAGTKNGIQEYLSGPYGYKHVSARGISGLSVVTENGEQPLILPSTHTSPFDSSILVRWGFSTAYDGSMDYTGSYPADELFQPNDPIIRSQIQSGVSDIGLVAFTSSLDPVTIEYSVDDLMSNQGLGCDWAEECFGNRCYLVPDGCPLNIQDAPWGVSLDTATLQSKNGRQYDYTHYVEYCSEFDDYRCHDIPSIHRRRYTNWAENPYPGLYLTKITDQFGNYIEIDYLGEGNPFIETITAPGGLQARFDYYCSFDDVDTRLYEVLVPNGEGENMYVVYEYYPDKPLLKKSYMKNHARNIISGTTYEYEYDEETQELIRVKLPTGAIVEYTYDWMYTMPAIDYLQGALDAGQQHIDDYEQFYYQPKRVVTTKTVKNAGALCGEGGEGPFNAQTKTCVWTYHYDFMGKTQYLEDPSGKYFRTIIVDPWHRKTVYYSHPNAISIIDGSDLRGSVDEWTDDLSFIYPEDLSFRNGLIFKTEVYEHKNGAYILVQESLTDWSSKFPFMNPREVLGSTDGLAKVGDNGELVGFVANIQRNFPTANHDSLDEGTVDYKLAIMSKQLSSETITYSEEGPVQVSSQRSIQDRYGNPTINNNYGYVGQTPICERSTNPPATSEGYITYDVRHPVYPYDYYVNKVLGHIADIDAEFTNLQGLDDLYSCAEPNTDATKMDTITSYTDYMYDTFDPANPTEHRAFYGWTDTPNYTQSLNAKAQLLSKNIFEYETDPSAYLPCSTIDHENNWKVVNGQTLRNVPTTEIIYAYTLDADGKTAENVFDTCGNSRKLTVSSKYGNGDGTQIITKQKVVETTYDAATNMLKPSLIEVYNPANPSLKLTTSATYWPGLATRTITNERGIVTNYDYDSAGKLHKIWGPYDSETYPTVKYAYDTYPMFGGREGVRILQQNKITNNNDYKNTHYFYNGLGKMIEYQVQNGPEVIISGSVFDIDGKLERAYRPMKDTGDSGVFNLQYYQQGCETPPCSFVLTKYDALGRTRVVKNTFDDSEIKTYYKTDGHLTVVESEDALDQITKQYTNARGDLVSIDIPSGTEILP